MQWTSVLCFVFVCYGSVAADDVLKPDIYSLHVDSEIRFRFAHTVISSRIANPNNISQEVSFSAVLPETAFISGFLIEVDGHVYNAYVKEKEEARQEYNEAVIQGRTAAHVALSARDSNRFTVSVNVEPQKKVTFNLTYEELLNRKLGTYKHVMNLDPGQVVRDLRVAVHIQESSDITKLMVPALRTSNEIDDSEGSGTTNPLAVIERPTPQSAVVVFAPNPDQQRELASEGIKGQLVVEYDVDRSQHPGEVLVNDGYFVHFFAPTDLVPLPKQVTFVLDVSGSMSGRKIEQLKQAMTTILGDLNSSDLFSIVIFSSKVEVWDPALNETASIAKLERLGQYYWNRNVEDTEPQELLTSSVIAEVNVDNIAKAKRFVEHLTSQGATNIYGALMKALDISKLGRQSVTAAEDNSVNPHPEPIIIFLTDGQPNVEESDTNTIVTRVTSANTGNSSVFSLALGNDADMSFLKKLSLRNTGFARKIYEASDTALQLRDFYRQVASPLLANVTFIYQPEQVQNSTLTKNIFRRFFSGSELVIAGRLQGDNVTGEVEGVTASGLRRFPFMAITPPLIPIDFPIPPPTPVNTTPSAMERLWAYVTIHQLLEEDEAKDYDRSDKNYTSPEKQQALDLALQYSFVTPLTSLVVVKPNDTSSVDTEDASQPDGGGSLGLRNMGSTRFMLPSAGAAAGLSYSPVGLPGMAGPPTNPVYYTSRVAGGGPSGGFPGSGAVPGAPSAGFPVSGAVPAAPNSGHPVPGSGAVPGVPNPDVLPDSLDASPLPTADPAVVQLSDVTWLPADNTSIVFPNEELHIASANETDAEYGSCLSPAGSGHCRHFRYCVLSVFTSLQSDYLPYMCRISGYAGVCCPYSLHST